MPFTLTVSQVNRYVKAVLEEDKKLSDLYVKGEISNFTRHYKSGHFYFSLKDAQSAVKAVMFKSHAQDLRFEPENGMAVLVRASVGVYERDGAYQLYVTDIQPDGAGALAVAFEQKKARLAALGLFDQRHKKPLPRFPKAVGVVTSQSGAALQDIIQVLNRRYPLAKLVLCPSSVQGEGAADSLQLALRTLDGRCDVLILARGGGSAEDLWSFNDEELAKAVFACGTPVISAVGHETDTTLCDLAADVRAPTPSAAAELAVPSAGSIRRDLLEIQQYLCRQATVCLERSKSRISAMAGAPALRDPWRQIGKKRERLDFLSKALYNNKKYSMERFTQPLVRQAALLDSLSPLRVLERGYCASFREEKPVLNAADLALGDRLAVRFRDGTAKTVVQQVTGEGME